MNSAKKRKKSSQTSKKVQRKPWSRANSKEEEEQEAREAEAEMLLAMENPCPCGGRKNFLKKNRETVGNTFLIKNHIYKNLYS